MASNVCQATKSLKTQKSGDDIDVLKRRIKAVEKASSDVDGDDDSYHEQINKHPRQDNHVGGVIGISLSSQATNTLNKKVKDGSFVKNIAR